MNDHTALLVRRWCWKQIDWWMKNRITDVSRKGMKWFFFSSSFLQAMLQRVAWHVQCRKASSGANDGKYFGAPINVKKKREYVVCHGVLNGNVSTDWSHQLSYKCAVGSNGIWAGNNTCGERVPMRCQTCCRHLTCFPRWKQYYPHSLWDNRTYSG